ncbi:MAG: iron-sulfur cluster assembly scaffold protein [Chloroflexota bacterium]|nr:iron-sulfur cluster assembly scaffold protein [Chloroflexota bacterium]
MADWFDELEKAVIADMYSHYTETVIDHATNPRNMRSMEPFDGHAMFTGPCGDTMDIWIRVKDDAIVAASFTTDGCGTSVAAGSMMTEMARGKHIAAAQRIVPEDVLAALGGLPEESEHCALLAVTALRRAIADYRTFKGQQWKRAYSR